MLDDVWTEEHEDWDELKPLFSRGVEGYKIILTTCSKKVAFMMDFPNSPYYLKRMIAGLCSSNGLLGKEKGRSIQTFR